MKIISLFLILLLIGGMGVIPAGVGDNLETLKVRFDKTPEVCIFDINPEDSDRARTHETLTRVSVDSWTEALFKVYPKGNWEIIIHEPIAWKDHKDKAAEDFPHCTIMVVFESLSGSDVLGTTSINFANSNHKFMVINVYVDVVNYNHIILGDNEMNYAIDPLNDYTLQSVIIHEFGHSFGLLHYINSSPIPKGMEGIEVSVMYPHLRASYGDIVEIKSPELIMMGKLYGEYGWNGIKYPVIVKSCDFLQNIAYDCKW
jgi:hypothetical protein